MDMISQITPFNKILDFPSVSGAWTMQTVLGLSNLSGEIERQAAMIGYINAFYLLGITGFVAIPLIFFAQKADTR
jgi:DHA2 family multidrug resistance protein